MGGRGSGGHCRWNAKSTTESQHCIDIRRLKKWGSLEPGRVGTLSWSSNGDKTASVGYRTEKDRMILNYRHRPQGGERETVEQTVLFNRTPYNYGGWRMWFICPGCMKRVAVLYGAGKYWMHRKTFELLKKEAEEATARSWREAARLGRP